jgi:hypothetical protein
MLPRLNPIVAPSLVCLECGERMRLVIEKGRIGLSKLIYYCDTEKCKYGFDATQEHKNGTSQAIPYVARK